MLKNIDPLLGAGLLKVLFVNFLFKKGVIAHELAP